MIDHQLGRELHQKKFKGESLTEQEQELLRTWYKQEDEVEANLLKVSIPEKSVIEHLRQQINEMLAQLTQLTQNIQSIATENDKIRKENERLFQLLHKQSDSRAA